MRIAIMGSGGVGGYVGGRLAASGQDVDLHRPRRPSRGDPRARACGSRARSATLAVDPAQASDDPAAIGPVDLVIFAVKLYDTEGAAAGRPAAGRPRDRRRHVAERGRQRRACCRACSGREHVIGGVAHIAAVIAAPGVIRHTGTMARLQFGELDGAQSERVAALSAALEAAGVDHQVSADIARDIWGKMVFLATFAGLTALIRLPIGPIREDSGHARPLPGGPGRGARRGPRQGHRAAGRFRRAHARPHRSAAVRDEVLAARTTWRAAAAWSCPGCPARSSAWARSWASPLRPTPSSPPRSSCTPTGRLIALVVRLNCGGRWTHQAARCRRDARRISGRAPKASRVMMWKSLT